MEDQGFSVAQRRLIGGISLIMALRMLGISLVIPIFSIFATGIEGSTGALAGVAAGIFGISQTILQVPFGLLSDRWGRKQTTILGLCVYLAGTVLCGLSQNINQLILARVVAGAGAVQGVTMAWLTEGIDTGKRNAALSWVGISMGSAVILGFAAGPIIAGRISIPVIFYICGGMILLSIGYTLFYLRNHDTVEDYHLELEKRTIRTVMRDGDIIRINLVGLLENACLTGIFFILPLLLKKEMGIAGMWKIYIPVSLAGTALMFYFGKRADRSGTVTVTLTGLAFALAGTLLPVFSGNLLSYCAALALFYSGHCILSPLLPAAVSRYPGVRLRGTVMGILNSSQFIGSSLGGFLGGIMLDSDPRYFFMILSLFIAASMAVLIGYRDFRKS